MVISCASMSKASSGQLYVWKAWECGGLLFIFIFEFFIFISYIRC